MPGRMGGNTVTVQNLEVVQVDTDNSVILVKGNVPGPKKGLVEITTSIKKVINNSRSERRKLHNG